MIDWDPPSLDGPEVCNNANATLELFRLYDTLYKEPPVAQLNFPFTIINKTCTAVFKRETILSHGPFLAYSEVDALYLNKGKDMT